MRTALYRLESESLLPRLNLERAHSAKETQGKFDHRATKGSGNGGWESSLYGRRTR